ncbi:MAG: hypothetical protein ACM3MF_12320, partial [Anaerolineae bacterium]
LTSFACDAGIWIGILVLVYFVFWPGMWVAPGKMLYEVFGNALSYALEGSRLSVTGGIDASQSSLNIGGMFSLLPSLLWRTTPVIWLGLPLGILAAMRQRAKLGLVVASVLLTGAAFMLLFGVANGRDSPHYLMTGYLALDITAAAGYAYAAAWLAPRLALRRIQLAVPAVLAAVVGLQALSALPYFPYYYTYYNPVMEALQPGRQNPSFGYGEGLELAARYLARDPDAARTTVMVYDGFGPFSFFYPGNTEQLKRVYADAQNVPEFLRVLADSKYVVLYYELERQRNSPPNVLRAFDGVEPEHSIWINSIEYVRIYRVEMLPPQFYAAFGQ